MKYGQLGNSRIEAVLKPDPYSPFTAMRKSYLLFPCSSSDRKPYKGPVKFGSTRRENER